MKTFQGTRAAKEFLAQAISAEAQRQGVSLSYIETKMLYFSESDPLSPSLEISDAFDRDYDQNQYERKIAGIVKGFLVYASSNDRPALDRWKEAGRLLQKEDHYLLILMDPSNIDNSFPTNSLKILGAGFVLACLGLAAVYFFAGR